MAVYTIVRPCKALVPEILSPRMVGVDDKINIPPATPKGVSWLCPLVGETARVEKYNYMEDIGPTGLVLTD